MTVKQILCLVLGLTLWGTQAHAIATYKIDPNHSSITFSVGYMGLGNVQGRFDTFHGEIQYDEVAKKALQIDNTIIADSINTNNEKRDKHLVTSDFLYTERFKSIYFSSMSIEKEPSANVVKGTLTLRGVTKVLEIPFTVSGPIKDQWGNERIALKALVSINRMDYGVLWNETLDNGTFIVDKTVHILLEIQAIREKKSTQALPTST